MIIQNKKGQALVEFVIILPIFIFMIFAVIDLGKILYFQNNLESKMDEVITAYEANKSYDEINNRLHLDDENVNLEVTNEDNEYIEFKLKRTTDIITPGLNTILGNPYEINAKRVIYYE